MALYLFTDSDERDYFFESANLHAVPGESYELPVDPGDGRWTVVKAPESTPVADSGPPETKDE